MGWHPALGYCTLLHMFQLHREVRISQQVTQQTQLVCSCEADMQEGMSCTEVC